MAGMHQKQLTHSNVRKQTHLPEPDYREKEAWFFMFYTHHYSESTLTTIYSLQRLTYLTTVFWSRKPTQYADENIGSDDIKELRIISRLLHSETQITFRRACNNIIETSLGNCTGTSVKTQNRDFMMWGFLHSVLCVQS